MWKRRNFLLSYTLSLLIIEYLCLYYWGRNWNIFDKIVFPLGILYCFPIIRTKVAPNKAKWAFFLYIALGLLANIIYQYQPLNAVVQDALLNMKFFLSICIGFEAFKYYSIERYRNKIFNVSKIALLGIAFLTVVNLICGAWMYPFYEDGRFWGHSVMLFFSHPTNLTAATVFYFALFVAFYNKKMYSRKMLLFFSVVLFIIFASGRYKGISVILGFIYLYWRFIYAKGTKKLKIDLIFVLLLMLYLVYDQIMLYFIEVDGSARSAMLVSSVDIARDHFPLGAGFGTFGSSASTTYYSPIYNMYGLSCIWGLGEGDARFVSDNYVATLLGQTGLTVIFFVYFLYAVAKEVFNLNSINKRYFMSALLLIMYITFASLSECSFVAIYSMPMGFWIGAMIAQRNSQGEHILV